MAHWFIFTIFILIAQTLSAVLAGSWDMCPGIEPPAFCDEQGATCKSCKCRPAYDGANCASLKEGDPCVIKTVNYGYIDPGLEHSSIFNSMSEEYFKPFASDCLVGLPRGISVTVFDHNNCAIKTECETFDTYLSTVRADAFRVYVDSLPCGSIIVLLTHDEYTKHLGCQQLLVDMGSPVPNGEHEFRSSLAIVTKKLADGTFCTIAADYASPTKGPVRLEVGHWKMMQPYCINDA